MQFKGKITNILPEKTGISSKSGREWRSQEFVVRDDSGRFPESFVFEVFNREIGAAAGDEVEVLFEGDAREYNGRFYNSLRAYRITPLSQAAPQQQPTNDYVPPQPEQAELPF